LSTDRVELVTPRRCARLRGSATWLDEKPVADSWALSHPRPRPSLRRLQAALSPATGVGVPHRAAQQGLHPPAGPPGGLGQRPAVLRTAGWPTCRCTTSPPTRSGARSSRSPPTCRLDADPRADRALGPPVGAQAAARHRQAARDHRPPMPAPLAATAPWTDLALIGLRRLDALAVPG
jgi:hypothetical protein